MDRDVAHFIWIGDSMPEVYQRGFNSFCFKHKTWNIRIWRNNDVEKIINESKYKLLFEKYGNKSFINKYNFIKYHILAEHGGWFVDLDINWKKSIDELYTDTLRNRNFPDAIVPVRNHVRLNAPYQKHLVQNSSHDDNLIYMRKGVMWGLLDYIQKRNDGEEKPYVGEEKYEPFGPISLSQWLHDNRGNIDQLYMFENQIQNDGYYCDHLNVRGWINE